MTFEEFLTLKELKNTVSVEELSDDIRPFTTLMYSYTCDRKTFEVCLELGDSGEKELVSYTALEVIARGKEIDVGYCIPDKRVYPEMYKVPRIPWWAWFGSGVIIGLFVARELVAYNLI